MTGNTSRGEGRRGTVTLSSGAPEFLSFGPRGQGFSRDPAERLYDERVDDGVAAARTGDGLLSLAGSIAKKVAEAAVKTVTRYNRPAFARARSDGAYQPGAGSSDIINPEKLDIYRSVLTGKYPVEEADQPFLRKITGKFSRYIYGANWGGKLFVDRILKRKSPEQTYATYVHEAGHTAHPELNDEGVETVSKAYAFHLATNDPSRKVRDRAWKAYRGLGNAGIYSDNGGFLETSVQFPRRPYAAAAA